MVHRWHNGSSIRARVLLTAVGGVAAATAALAPGASAATANPNAGASTAAPSAAAAACDKTPWEAKVQGRPGYHPGGASGDYLWHDTAGFHLRVTHHTNERIVYSGQIESSAAMRLNPVKLEGKDFAVLSANRRYLTFRFQNYGHTDGVDFHTDCATGLTVRWLHADGHSMSDKRVYLGATGAHPQHVPFTVRRVVKTT